MGKNDYKRITLSELIAKAEQRVAAKGNPKVKEFYVQSLEGTVLLKAPKVEEVADATKLAEDGGNEYLIYSCCVDPNLKDKELQESYGVAEPVELVQKIFEPGEIASLSIECMKLAGYSEDSVRPVDTIKN